MDYSLASIAVDFIQLQIEKSEMSGPIEKIIDYGIGSNYDSGQVYCSKFLKIGKANLNDVSNRASNFVVYVGGAKKLFQEVLHIGFVPLHQSTKPIIIRMQSYND